MLRHTINKMATMAYLLTLLAFSLVPSIANLRAKEKGDALAKQAIVFANLERVFLGQPKAAKLCTILSLLRSNVHYM